MVRVFPWVQSCVVPRTVCRRLNTSSIMKPTVVISALEHTDAEYSTHDAIFDSSQMHSAREKQTLVRPTYDRRSIFAAF